MSGTEQPTALPRARDVVREDDGELVGRLVPQADGWVPTTTFGAPLGDPTDEDAAEAVVRERGMSALAEPWLLTRPGGGEPEDVLLLEVRPDRVRLRPAMPEPDDDPAGEWVAVAAVGLRPARR